jgi:hypothetical protein
MINLLFVSMLVSGSGAPQPQPPSVLVIEIPAPDVIQELELTDGSSIIGRVESIGEGRFVFRSTAGVVMTVDPSTVRSLKPVTGRIVRGELWREDPNQTRLFFGPTGRSLKKGEAYFGDFERPFWVTPKFEVIRHQKTSASVGVMHFFNIDEAGIGIAYGVVTHGGGYSYARTDREDAGSGVVMLGGEQRVTKRVN